MDKTNKKVQELTLNTLNIFIDFCNSYNLRYYLTGGALIGVMRHKGFIPWDDDIDIVMPRKDFDRFQKLIKANMPVGFGICNRYTDKNWHFAMSQFIDKESEIEIHLAEKARFAHIWVDVYPLDGLPNNKIARWFRVKNVMFHRYLVQLAHINTQVDSHRKRPLLEKMIISVCKKMPMDKLINTDKTIDKIEKILRKSDFDKSDYCGNMLGRYREKEVVPRIWFGTCIKGVFEGKKINIPENSDAVLTAIYGDYMKLPPENEQVAHNVKVIKCRNIDS